MTNSWQTVPLRQVLKLDLTKVPLDAGTDYPMVGVYSFGRGLFLREPVSGNNTSYKFFYQLKAEHIVMSQLFGWEGALALSSEKFVGLFVSPQFPTFSCDESQLDREFLGWIMRRKSFWDDLGSRTKGMGDRRRTLNPEALLTTEIPLPPLTEQRRIVAHIESLAARVNEAQRLREEASEETDYYKASLLNAAFAGKLLSNEAEVNKDFEDGRVLLEKILSERKELAKNGKYEIPSLPDPQSLPELPKGWVWVTVDHICSKVTDGFHNTPKPTESGFPYVLATHVKSNGIDFKNCFYVSEADHAELYAKTQVKRGDILVVNIGAGSGTPVIVNVDFEFSFKNVAILKRLSQVDEKFMYFYLLSKRAELFKEITKGGAQPFLSLKSLRTIPFPLAPLSEQKRIVAKLEELFSEVQKVSVLQEETRKEIDAFLPSILDRAFKGEL